MDDIDLVFTYDVSDRHDEYIDRYKRRLEQQGLVLSRIQEGRFDYVKIYAPWDVLCVWAETIHLQKPLKITSSLSISSRDPGSSMKCWCVRKDLPQEMLPPVNSIFTDPFNKHRLSRYQIDSPGSFFTKSEKSLIVWEILLRTSFGPTEGELTRDLGSNDSNLVGIERLVSLGLVRSVYALHEGDLQDPGSPKQLLYVEWAKFKNALRMQPLWYIKNYFGDQIGLYFTFLGFYNWMLFFLSIAGFITSLYGISSRWIEGLPVEDYCSQDKDSISQQNVCPNCIDCPFSQLFDQCHEFKINNWFQNSATIPFSFFLCLWALLFPKLWRRERSTVAWIWGINLALPDHSIRPQYQARVKRLERNPWTGDLEPRMSSTERFCRLLISVLVTILMLFLLILKSLGIIYIRVQMTQTLPRILGYHFVFAVIAVIDYIAMAIFHAIYGTIILKLTELELPRTYREFDRSLTLKTFFLNFINYYASFFYVALLKGKFIYFQDDIEQHNDISFEKCQEVGCWSEVTIQVTVFVIIHQIFNNINELIIPWLIKSYKEGRNRFEPNEKFIEENYLEDYNYSTLFTEYEEMVVQYAIVIMFSAFFPLAPVFALINNIFEIRIDARKFLLVRKRPIMSRINPSWLYIIETLSFISIVTNATALAFTSDLVSQYYYRIRGNGTLEGFVRSQYTEHIWSRGNHTPCLIKDVYNNTESDFKDLNIARLIFIIVFTAAVIVVYRIITSTIEDIPLRIQLLMKKEKDLRIQITQELEG